MTEAERKRARQAGRIEHHEAQLYAALERVPKPAEWQTLVPDPERINGLNKALNGKVTDRWRKIALVVTILAVTGWLLFFAEMYERKIERKAYHEGRGIEATH